MIHRITLTESDPVQGKDWEIWLTGGNAGTKKSTENRATALVRAIM
jgi:hypothetical protein